MIRKLLLGLSLIGLLGFTTGIAQGQPPPLDWCACQPYVGEEPLYKLTFDWEATLEEPFPLVFRISNYLNTEIYFAYNLYYGFPPQCRARCARYVAANSTYTTPSVELMEGIWEGHLWIFSEEPVWDAVIGYDKDDIVVLVSLMGVHECGYKLYLPLVMH